MGWGGGDEIGACGGFRPGPGRGGVRDLGAGCGGGRGYGPGLGEFPGAGWGWGWGDRGGLLLKTYIIENPLERFESRVVIGWGQVWFGGVCEDGFAPDVSSHNRPGMACACAWSDAAGPDQVSEGEDG